MIAILFLLLISSSINTNTLEDRFDEALISIREADRVGADISELVERFNTALLLNEEIEKGKFNSCSSYYECKDKIDNILSSVINDARALKETYKDSQGDQRLAIFVIYVPLISLASAFASVFIYDKWERYKIKKFLSMHIKIKDEPR